MSQGDLFAARQRRDVGMQSSYQHAEQDVPEWGDLAYNYLLDYARRHGDFLIEDVRASAAGYVPEPPELRAWGAVINKAARRGLIRKVGYKLAKSSNCSPKCLWRAA